MRILRSAGYHSLLAACLTLVAASFSLAASTIEEELKVKRQEPFEFARKPEVTLDGDRVTITFETKALCDVTVAVEGEDGKIVRHLASGVLGPNAPEPFQKNSKSQTVVWDGKNDFGEYIDDKAACRVRVSLGLKPQFEKTLFWHPKKRNGRHRISRMVAQPEGVYVYEGDGVEQVRLFSHQGEYVRTVHPFPAHTIERVKGLEWIVCPDGARVPKKIGYWQSTFLLGGIKRTDTGPGSSADAFAVNNGMMAIVADRLSRIATDGTTGAFDLHGPACLGNFTGHGRILGKTVPRSAALSPDHKWLYLTGYYLDTMATKTDMNPRPHFGHGVYRMEFGGNEAAKLWLGSDLPGKGDTQFDHPLSVNVDRKGNVFVADNGNNRVQVFSPEGKPLHSIAVPSPAIVQFHHRTGDIYVFSWDALVGLRRGITATLTILSPLASGAKVKQSMPLPFRRDGVGRFCLDPIPLRAVVDSWADPPMVWLFDNLSGQGHLKLYALEGDKLVLKQDWHKQVVSSIKRFESPQLARQRLYVDPVKGTLYVAEGDSGVWKAFTRLVRIDPDKEKYHLMNLPMSAEDMVIDAHRHAYLRTTEVIGRFDLDTWREIPFDYGEARATRFNYDCKGTTLISALWLPSQKPVYWHQQGFDVNFNGDIAVFCHNAAKSQQHKHRDGRQPAPAAVARPYTPQIYPGRNRYGELHIFDRHGKVKHEDAVQGLPDGHGTSIDAKGDVYVFIRGSGLNRKGKVVGDTTGTLAKFRPGKGGRLLVTARVPLPLSPELRPDRPPDVRIGEYGDAWIENAEWRYHGVGFFRLAPCQCWNCRFALDYLGRSFVPEMTRSQFAVLDTNGNLITRIGRYGNVDDGKPSNPGKHEPPNARSIGGDEVALMYAPYVATHTDRRLFIADPGNMRILSVKLGYHAEEKVALKDVAGE
jgi:hypothetical protein